MYKIMTQYREATETKDALWSIYKEENDDGDMVELEMTSAIEVEEKIKSLIENGTPSNKILVYNPNAFNITVDVSEEV